MSHEPAAFNGSSWLRPGAGLPSCWAHGDCAAAAEWQQALLAIAGACHNFGVADQPQLLLKHPHVQRLYVVCCPTNPALAQPEGMSSANQQAAAAASVDWCKTKSSQKLCTRRWRT